VTTKKKQKRRRRRRSKKKKEEKEKEEEEREVGENSIKRVFVIFVLAPTVFWLIRSRSIKWARNVARVGEESKGTEGFFWGGGLTDKADFERVDVAGRIIMIWILKK
jgi:hypothetical protein